MFCNVNNMCDIPLYRRHDYVSQWQSGHIDNKGVKVQLTKTDFFRSTSNLKSCPGVTRCYAIHFPTLGH